MKGITVPALYAQQISGEYFPNDDDQSGLRDGQVTLEDLNSSLTASIFPYKKYVGFISSSTTATVTAGFTVTVLENTIGDIVWTHPSSGAYVATLVDAFPAGKTFIMSPTSLPGLDGDESGLLVKVAYGRLSTSAVRLVSSVGAGVSDDIPFDTHPFEIRIYP